MSKEHARRWLSERIPKFVFQIRGMWKAADMVYESQRNVLGMTIELANEIERRIKPEAENKALREALSAEDARYLRGLLYPKGDGEEPLCDALIAYADILEGK